MALLFKRIPYDLNVLSGSEGEHLRQPFLGINPRGKVPVVEHEGLRVTDSLGIMAWLDREFPTRPLFGETSSEAAEIWSLATELEDFMRPIHHAAVFPILVEGVKIDAMDEAEKASMAHAAEELFAEFQRLEHRMGGGPFLLGPNPSAADAVAFPDVRLIDRMNAIAPTTAAAFGYDRFRQRFPRLTAWRETVEALPDFQGCLPPHWAKMAA
jgi:maleylpyruvate isomerase